MWLPKTENILNILSEEENVRDYVFVGGSALSYYLNHRLSEDIDLASPDEFLKMDNSIDRIASNLSKKGITIIEKPESASRYYERNIYANDVKITLYAANENFLQKEHNILKNNLSIANLDAIIAMKGMVIHNRAVLRDYYDLYALTKTFGIERVIQEAWKFYNTDKLTRFNKANFLQEIVNLGDIEDETIEPYLKPKYNITKTDLEGFFSEKAKEYITQQLKLNSLSESETQLNNYKSIYKDKGLHAALEEIKKDKKDTGWIMFYKGKLFPDKTRAEIENAVRKLDRDQGIGR